MDRLVWIYLLGVVNFLASLAAGNSCSEDKLATSFPACIDGIKNAVVNQDLYWFGTSFQDNCPKYTWYQPQNIECFTDLSTLGSVKDLIGIDETAIRIYLNVTYTSKPGEYSGCDSTVVKNSPTTHVINPLSTDPIAPWELRDMPQVKWEADANIQYTLIVFDVAVGVLHGLYMNIPGNDMSKASVMKSYHGPRNPQPKANLYIFLLYKQDTKDMTLSEQWKGKLHAMKAFKVADFTSEFNLFGPIGVNNVLASNDLGSVQSMFDSGVVSNCASFVEKAYASQKHELPFLRGSPQLTVFMRIKFHNTKLNITYCCEDTIYEDKEFYLDPIGDPRVLPAMTRVENDMEVYVRRHTFFPNATKDFEGKLYTLLAVDPDVPYDTVGTRQLPLLHGLFTNNKVDSVVGKDGHLTPGDIIVPYAGPKPPDDKPHGYYFMLFEQNGKLDIQSSLAYTGNCPDRIKSKCLFNVTKLISDNRLNLVAMSWMKAENDDFVNNLNNINQTNACKGREGYADPCPVADDSDVTAGAARLIVTTPITLFISLSFIINLFAW